MSNRKETVLRVALLPDGRLEVEDWRGNVHACRSADLGSRVRSLLDDPNLPPVEVVNPGATQVAEFYVRQLLPPDLRPLAGPGVQALQDVFARIQRMLQRPLATAPTGPVAEPEMPRHPPGSAHRRGRRVA